jgi:hypothetical protein
MFDQIQGAAENIERALNIVQPHFLDIAIGWHDMKGAVDKVRYAMLHQHGAKGRRIPGVKLVRNDAFDGRHWLQIECDDLLHPWLTVQELDQSAPQVTRGASDADYFFHGFTA